MKIENARKIIQDIRKVQGWWKIYKCAAKFTNDLDTLVSLRGDLWESVT